MFVSFCFYIFLTFRLTLSTWLSWSKMSFSFQLNHSFIIFYTFRNLTSCQYLSISVYLTYLYEGLSSMQISEFVFFSICFLSYRRVECYQLINV